MPAEEDTDERRGKPLATFLFWGGVGLAPLAALLLLLAQGNGPLRIAAVLAVLAVVLIGLSITMRGDVDTVRLEMEEALLGEIDELRDDLRNDIATAARATHAAFGEKLQVLQSSVDALRGQLETVRSGSAVGDIGPRLVGSRPAGPQVPGPEIAVAAAAGPPESDARRSVRSAHQPGHAGAGHDDAGYPPDDRGRGGYADPGRYDRPGPAAADRPEAGAPRQPTSRFGPVSGGPAGRQGWPDGGHRPDAGRSGAPGDGWSGTPGGGSRAPVPTGVVRHTETVKVTTRQTIVGPPDVARSGGNLYGTGNLYGGGEVPGGGDHRDVAGFSRDQYPPAGYGDRVGPGDWSAQPRRGRRSAPDDDSWHGDQRHDDQRHDDQRHDDQRHGENRSRGEDRSWDGDRSRERDGGWQQSHDGRRAGDPAADGRWSGVQAGERWASVRSDDRGREIRMGERQAAMRADGSGAELRIEDRWAEVRQNEPSREGSGGEDVDRSGGQRAPGGYWSGAARHWQNPEVTPAQGHGVTPAPDRAVQPSRDATAQPWREPGGGRHGGAPALPTGGAEPPVSWDRGPAEPMRGRRHRAEEEYGYPPADDVPRAGGTRRAEFDHPHDRRD